MEAQIYADISHLGVFNPPRIQHLRVVPRSYDIVVIGGGITGLGVANTAAEMGFQVAVIEKDTIGQAASKNNHRLVHSGGRYLKTDPEAARECYEANQTLRRSMPDMIDDTGGYFLAVSRDEGDHGDAFIHQAGVLGIPVEDVDPVRIRENAPKITQDLVRAIWVPDATMNVEGIVAQQEAKAREQGVVFLTGSEVKGFEQASGRINAVKVFDKSRGRTRLVESTFVINAAGPWAREIDRYAQVNVPVTGDKGVMLGIENVSTSTLNRLRVRLEEEDPQLRYRPGSGDIFVSDGKYSILGTTSQKVDNFDRVTIEESEIQELLNEGRVIIPSLRREDIIFQYAGVRPVLGEGGRGSSRTFQVIDHRQQGVDNMVSVIGGKFMLFQMMGARTMDVVATKLVI